jgi:hypothetical protein
MRLASTTPSRPRQRRRGQRARGSGAGGQRLQVHGQHAAAQKAEPGGVAGRRDTT